MNAGQPGVCQTIHGGALDDAIGEVLGVSPSGVIWQGSRCIAGSNLVKLEVTAGCVTVVAPVALKRASSLGLSLLARMIHCFSRA